MAKQGRQAIGRASRIEGRFVFVEHISPGEARDSARSPGQKTSHNRDQTRQDQTRHVSAPLSVFAQAVLQLTSLAVLQPRVKGQVRSLCSGGQSTSRTKASRIAALAHWHDTRRCCRFMGGKDRSCFGRGAPPPPPPPLSWVAAAVPFKAPQASRRKIAEKTRHSVPCNIDLATPLHFSARYLGMFMPQ